MRNHHFLWLPGHSDAFFSFNNYHEQLSTNFLSSIQRLIQSSFLMKVCCRLIDNIHEINSWSVKFIRQPHNNYPNFWIIRKWLNAVGLQVLVRKMKWGKSSMSKKWFNSTFYQIPTFYFRIENTAKWYSMSIVISSVISRPQLFSEQNKVGVLGACKVKRLTDRHQVMAIKGQCIQI